MSPAARRKREAMPEPPLTQRELMILRGMIDEHEFAQMRGRYFRGLWRDSRVVVAALVGGVLIVLQLVTLWLGVVK
jgi:hypothetical protein